MTESTRKARSLTRQDCEMVELVAQGYNNKEIAENMAITEQMVKNRLGSIFMKLGVSDRLELALYAVYEGSLISAQR